MHFPADVPLILAQGTSWQAPPSNWRSEICNGVFHRGPFLMNRFVEMDLTPTGTVSGPHTQVVLPQSNLYPFGVKTLSSRRQSFVTSLKTIDGYGRLFRVRCEELPEMKSALNSKMALLGGVLAGIGASACCVGPILLLSLGISGAWISHLTALEPYRPVFIVLTVLFLGFAFWKLYLAPQSCAVEDKCLADRTRNVQRVFFWILAPVTLGLVASPWLLPIFYR